MNNENTIKEKAEEILPLLKGLTVNEISEILWQIQKEVKKKATLG